MKSYDEDRVREVYDAIAACLTEINPRSVEAIKALITVLGFVLAQAPKEDDATNFKNVVAALQATISECRNKGLVENQDSQQHSATTH